MYILVAGVFAELPKFKTFCKFFFPIFKAVAGTKDIVQSKRILAQVILTTLKHYFLSRADIEFEKVGFSSHPNL